MGLLSSLFRSAPKAPETRAADSNYFSFVDGLTQQGLTGLNQDQAMKFAAVYRAVSLRAETVASLPLEVYQITAEGIERNNNHPTFYPLHVQPNKTQSAFTFWETLSIQIDLWGNGYAKILRNGAGTFIGLELKNAWETTVNELEGELYYSFKDETDSGNYSAADVVHIPGLSFNGLVGKSKIHAHQTVIEGAIEATKTNAKFWKNGAFFRGVLKLAGVANNEKAQQAANSFATQWGANGQWGTPVIDSTADFVPISMPHRDAQYIDSLKFSIEEVARIFNVPLSKLMHLDGAKFSNYEQQQLDWVIDGVRPTVKRIEAELQRKLYARQEPAKVKFNLEGLLRGDLKTRSSFYKDLFFIGALSPNEIRKRENLNPRENGNEYFTPVNMYDSEQLALNKAKLEAETNNIEGDE